MGVVWALAMIGAGQTRKHIAIVIFFRRPMYLCVWRPMAYHKLGRVRSRSRTSEGELVLRTKK